ncbi:MAG: prepilin-type N-terminal cleavage/methylation domain-containing protein, partial [Candidatus Riflebacteria bacterium]|nr:prepilin-type N-terminal cleavage/methylation domain-containing protein [Candidatus Riflebacteria bacterium]
MRTRKGFTIIELLIVVIVIGILAAAGLAKYQNFAETSRRKTCLSQIMTIENAMAVWETTNQAFAENAKCAFGFTTRTGQLTGTVYTPSAVAADNILSSGTAGTIGSIADIAAQPTQGAPPAFYNAISSGPLGSVIRDDKVWVCPSALARYYGGEIQNVHDSYMDTQGGGQSPAHGGTTIGLGGRYLAVVAGRGNTNAGNTPIGNFGFPSGWITGSSVASNTAAPAPQTPFKIVICGCYGSFGPGTAAAVPGTTALNSG